MPAENQANGFKALQSTNHPKTNALQVTTIQAVRAGNSSDVLGKSGNAAIGRYYEHKVKGSITTDWF